MNGLYKFKLNSTGKRCAFPCDIVISCKWFPKDHFWNSMADTFGLMLSNPKPYEARGGKFTAPGAISGLWQSQPQSGDSNFKRLRCATWSSLQQLPGTLLLLFWGGWTITSEYVVSRKKMVIIVQKLGFEKKNGIRVFQTEANVVKTTWAIWERSQATCSWALSGSNSLAGSSSAWSPSRSSAVAEEMIQIGHNCSNPSHLHISYWQFQKATNLLVSDKAFYAKISVRHLSCSACSSCFCSSSSWT